MKGLVRIILALVFISAINIVILFKWLAPVLSSNIERGYYDAFSLISVLCGNNPDESAIHYLNSNNYDGVLFFMFMTPGVLVSWFAFFAIYKTIFWDAPLSFFYQKKED
ncbi:hypothetical protein OBQ87_004508, partial [Salmonella enterica subsp. enterica serovar Braenderup]|nr:hypothetical protein [Salmonella enterica subsp. enterica serovar Braenderup]